jgi:4-diphosphocytidyl-2-C-methyl-D-erythritol kinase
LGIGRGEQVRALEPFAALRGAGMLLIHPGFGISTPWAYQQLARFPQVLNGEAGRADHLIRSLNSLDLPTAGREFYNSLEAPAFRKYPLLAMFQDFLREQGATVTLMSGSGSTTFALATGKEAAENLRQKFLGRFGASHWTETVEL